MMMILRYLEMARGANEDFCLLASLIRCNNTDKIVDAIVKSKLCLSCKYYIILGE